MKRTLQMVAAALMLTTATVAQAQGGGGGRRGGTPEQRMAQQKTRMFEGLTLTDEQTTKVDSIMMASMKAQTEMRAGASGGGGMAPEMMEKMKAIATKQRSDIRAILKPDQLEMYDANIAKMMTGRRGPGA